jgi:hypothetical protein
VQVAWDQAVKLAVTTVLDAVEDNTRLPATTA